jgi:hypothetical protein
MSTPPKISMLWEAYRDRAYGRKLPDFQDLELSLAFYAGIEQAFRMVDVVSEREDRDEDAARLLVIFRDEVKKAAARAKLDRATGNN